MNDRQPPQPNTPRGPIAKALVNMAWVLGDKALAMVVGLLIFGLIGRTLGPVASGHFAYAAALLQVGLGLSLVVSGSALLPRLCRQHAALPGTIANVFSVRMVASLLASAAMGLYCLLAIGDAQRRVVAMILVMAVPLIEPFYVIAAYWLSRNHNRPNVVARSSALLVRATIVVVGLHFGAPLWVLAMAWVVEAALNATIQSAQLRRAMPGKRFARFIRASRARRYLAFGLRFVPALWLQALFMRLDRLLLSERMDSVTFGLYATAMQLSEVWSQVAYLTGVSLATAHLYERIRRGHFAHAFIGTFAAMITIGLVGLAGAWWFGPWVLRWIFGPQFTGSQPYLVAGMAFSVLLFGNQIVMLTLTTLNRARTLIITWSIATMVAAVVIHFGYLSLGALAGPCGLAAGTISAWLALLPLVFDLRRSSPKPSA